MNWLPLLLVFSFLASGCQARAQARVEGKIECSSSSCYIKEMKIDGQMDSSTVENVRRLVEELHKKAEREKKDVHPYSVALNSPGGSVTAAFALGRILRSEGIGASVESSNLAPPDDCISACVLVFAGAVHRSIWARAKLGIHRPYLEVPHQNISSDKVREGYVQTLQDVRAYLREMNVSEQLADAMFRVEPENVRFLDEKAATAYELTEWGLRVQRNERPSRG
jgi:hypothetical protein